jgi:hypothetical protein
MDGAVKRYLILFMFSVLFGSEIAADILAKDGKHDKIFIYDKDGK